MIQKNHFKIKNAEKIPFENVEMKCFAIWKVSFLFFSDEMSNKWKSNLHTFYHMKTTYFIKSIIHLHFWDSSISDV